MLFPVTDNDRRIYETGLRDFLPPEMIDIHCHVWRNADKDNEYIATHESVQRTVSWPGLVAAEDPIDDLDETYRLMFPDKKVTPLFFSTTCKGSMKAMNEYCKAAAKEKKYPALYFSKPTESPEELEYELITGGWYGIKGYLDLSPEYLPEPEIRIFDFFPPAQLEVLNKLKMIVMLHIPRPKRFRDPVNIAQIIEIKERWPNIKLIIAHIGRAYCRSDVGDAFEKLAKSKACDDLMFDFCANTNQYVMKQLLEAVGPKRVMWGTDLPITRMRMRRIEENGTYINLIPPGLYGDPSVDPHLREVPAEEAGRITFFMYEELLAMKWAMEQSGYMSERDRWDIFHDNAARLIGMRGLDPKAE